MSALCLLYSSVGRPNFLSLSGYDKFLQALTNLVARRCIFSNAILSFWYSGDHTTVAYSRWGLTRDFYNVRKISVSRNVNILKMMPKFLLAKLTFDVMWSLKVSLLSIMTPKSFSLATFSMTWVPSWVYV